MRAYILINVGALETTLSEMKELYESIKIKEIDRVLGPWDFVAEVEVENENGLADIVAKIRSSDYIKGTLTLIAERD